MKACLCLEVDPNFGTEVLNEAVDCPALGGPHVGGRDDSEPRAAIAELS